MCKRGSNRALPKGKLWLPELLTYCKCLSFKAKLWIHIQHFCSTAKRFLVHHKDEKWFSVKREIARGVRRHVAVTQTVTQTLISIIWQWNSAYLSCLILYNLSFFTTRFGHLGSSKAVSLPFPKLLSPSPPIKKKKKAHRHFISAGRFSLIILNRAMIGKGHTSLSACPLSQLSTSQLQLITLSSRFASFRQQQHMWHQ